MYIVLIIYPWVRLYFFSHIYMDKDKNDYQVTYMLHLFLSQDTTKVDHFRVENKNDKSLYNCLFFLFKQRDC